MRSFGTWFCITLLITGPIIVGGLLLMRGGVCAQSPGEVTPGGTPYYQRLAETAHSPFDKSKPNDSKPNDSKTNRILPPPVLLPTTAAAPVVSIDRREGSEPPPMEIPEPVISASNRSIRAVEMVRATSVTEEPELATEQITTASFVDQPTDSPFQTSSNERPPSAVVSANTTDTAPSVTAITTPAGLLPGGAATIPATIAQGTPVASMAAVSSVQNEILPQNGPVPASPPETSAAPVPPLTGTPIASVEPRTSALPASPSPASVSPLPAVLPATPQETVAPRTPAETNPIPSTHPANSTPVDPAIGTTLVTQSVPAEPDPATEPAFPEPAISTPPVPPVAPNASESTPPEATTSEPQTPSSDSEPVSPVAVATERQVLSSQESPAILIETIGTPNVSIGKEATYEITVRNSGNVTVEQLVVQATIPPQLEVQSVGVDPGEVTHQSGQCEWKLPKLDPYGRATMTVVGMPRSSESFSITVRVTVPPMENTTAIEVLEPKLSLSLQGPPKMLADHSEVFRLVLQNTGTGDAEDVRIVLTTLANGQDQEVTVPHPIGTIPPGEPQQLDMRMTARRAGPLQVKVLAQNDSLGTLAEASTSIEVCKPEIAVALEGPGLQYVGGLVNYRFAIRNSGTATAENVVVRATLPETAKWVSDQPETTLSSQDRQLTWTLPNLAPGMEQNCVIGVEAIAPGACVTQVEATADGNLQTATQLPSTIEAVASLSLNVEEPGRPVFVENEAVYTLTIHNEGSAAASRVGITGEFGNGVVPISADGGEFRSQGTRILFEPIKSIAPGETLTIRVRTQSRTSGNRMWKFEVSSAEDGIQVARQGTTRFYGDSSVAPITPSLPQPRPEPTPGLPMDPNAPTAPDAAASSVPPAAPSDVATSQKPANPDKPAAPGDTPVVPISQASDSRKPASPSDGMVPLPGLSPTTPETARHPETPQPTSDHRFFGSLRKTEKWNHVKTKRNPTGEQRSGGVFVRNRSQFFP